jgi:hypothetical protein
MKTLDDKIDYGLGLIIGSLGGNNWEPETVQIYRHQFSDIRDGDCFIKACEDVVGSWDSPGKPTPRFIRDAYKAQIIRRELEAPPRAEIEEGGRGFPAWRDGVEIARRAYASECAKFGRAPREGQPESLLARCYDYEGTLKGPSRLS